MRTAHGVLASVVALWLVAVPTAAQETQLDRVEELTRMGRAEEAREALTEWWDGARDESSRRDLQRGLWLRGRLTVDPQQAELDFQRLVVLYPNGPFSAQALLRLAQGAYAQGEVDVARGHIDQLARDYPTSPTRAEGEEWWRAVGAPPSAPGGQRQPLAGTGSRPVQTPAPDSPAQPGSGATDDVAGAGIRPSQGGAVAPADAVLDWFVQFGAFSDEDRAFTLQRELVDAGLAARLVRVEGSGFLHVRIGRYATREEASRQLDDVTRRGFTAALVRDGRAEEVVRR